MSTAYFIGIDIGTQGVRVVLLDEAGQQLCVREEVFPLNNSSREQQSPDLWWQGCERLIPAVLAEVEKSIQLSKIKAVAVTSTSGTIIPLGHDHNPLHPAIMYSDPRSGKEAEFCKEVAANEVKEGYTAFNSSSGLPKMRWYLTNFPEKVGEIYKFIHASDFITGRLCGEYGITDYTNALKSGYNLHSYHWPSYINQDISIRGEWLQMVKPSGEPLGTLKPNLAEDWGLSPEVIVTTGMTDGCASQVASGAVSPGQWNTTIGTTMVIKGVTREEVIDPSGAIYNHRHPAGYWMPGGASNTGADWVSRLFENEDLRRMEELTAAIIPAEDLAWPLLQQGERFPFFSPQATGFWPSSGTVENFAACMEGVAFIERLAYERITQLSGEQISAVFSAGGASNSETWMRIRSSVINRPVYRMKNVSGAAGAAILAASRTHYTNLQEAAEAMVSPEKAILPEDNLVHRYKEKYQRFVIELKKRKFLQ